MTNFNDLPCDIKSVIFKHNQFTTGRERNQRNYDKVVEELWNHLNDYQLSCVWSGELQHIHHSYKDVLSSLKACRYCGVAYADFLADSDEDN